jgi:hypothetical protein
MKKWFSAILFSGCMAFMAQAQWSYPLAENSQNWRSVDDRVMGGVSQSLSGLLESGEFAFAGRMSLANNGGFASIRAPLIIPEAAATDAHKIRIKVQGDGKRYQLRFRTSGRFDGISYAVSFPTEPNAVLTYEFALSDFRPTWRGRVVPNAPALTWTDVRQVGWMLTDKQPGDFALVIHEMTWTKAILI